MWNTRPAEEALNKELTEQAANYENIICEYKRDVKQAVEKIDSFTAEVERLKAVLRNIVEFDEKQAQGNIDIVECYYTICETARSALATDTNIGTKTDGENKK